MVSRGQRVASKDIGRAIALCFADAGSDVMIAGRNEAALKAVQDEIAADGHRVKSFLGDLTDQNTIFRLGQDGEKYFGAPTIWVNNVGAKPDLRKRPVNEVTLQTFDAEVAATLKATWLGVQTAAVCLGSGGCIINISSLVARAALEAEFSLPNSAGATQERSDPEPLLPAASPSARQ